MTSLTQTPAWQALAAHREALSGITIRSLFEQDNERAAAFSLEAAGLFADFSKNLLTGETLALLAALARDGGV